MASNEQAYIRKHEQYVNYRVNILSDYVASVNSEKTIPYLIAYLIKDWSPAAGPINLPGHITAVLNELSTIIDSWDIFKDGDIIGCIYQQLESRHNKKTRGQFFTPGDIVSYLVSQSVDKKSMKNFHVLDPACGSGQFLLETVKHLREQHASDKNRTCIIKKYVSTCLYGFDSDPVAVSIARYNLCRVSGCKAPDIHVYCLDFLNRDGLYLDKHLLLEGTFDLVVGNPPWGSAIPARLKRYYRHNYYSARSGINTFTLFIERSFDYIKKGGTISFLVPEAYLNIKAHANSRRLVLDNAEIRCLSLWGERFKGVFAPSASIIIQHQEEKEYRGSNVVHIHSAQKGRTTATMVPQKNFHATPDVIFNINYSRKAVTLISSIEEKECFYLKNRATFFLGIVTGNNAHHIATEQSELHPHPIIIGKDVSQYRIAFSNHFFNFDRSSLQQVAPQHLYTSRDKILYRFIGKRLTFALDRQGYYSLNNVNGFIPLYDHVNIETTLSLLNSQVLQYYYEKNFFTIKVLRGNLERLPLRYIGKHNQEKIKKLTMEILDSEQKDCSVQRGTIEDIIFHEYGIKDREAYLIQDTLQ